MTDVLIIGLGGSGGIAADVLTRAGLEVVALEAGPRRAPAEMTLDELRNDVHAWLAEPKARGELPTWRADAATEAGVSPWPLLMVNAVGGSTLHYPGLSARFHPWNFAARSSTVARYGAGAVPAGSTLADWPVGYDELEPYYDEVERAIGVAGQAGRIARQCREAQRQLGRAIAEAVAVAIRGVDLVVVGPSDWPVIAAGTIADTNDGAVPRQRGDELALRVG